jgi:hypothetical protein
VLARPLTGGNGGRTPFNDLADTHSITSSAMARTDGGTSRPSAFAVLRLIISSNSRRLLHWQFGRPLTFEDTACIDASYKAALMCNQEIT